MQKTATVNEKPLLLLSLTKRLKKDEQEVATGHTMQPTSMPMPAPAPYAYPPPPVIIVPPAIPWGRHGYPRYLPPPLGSLLPLHTITGHTSYPTTSSLLIVELLNANPTKTVPFPDIIHWFLFLNQHVWSNQHVSVSVDFTAFGPILEAKGFLNILQLSHDYICFSDRTSSMVGGGSQDCYHYQVTCGH
ncbi:hypothetical protein J3R82DRAFT_100 [Butyriboletus roseoflavus]|nr:hypothetical protein J3R82DRAFT_100 [Butyriboletus roseoflavus]